MKITNQWQYRHAKVQVRKFSEVLESGLILKQEGDPRLLRAQRDGLESERTALEVEITEYERLRHPRWRKPKLDFIHQVPEALVAARIAAGLTQAELAARLGMKPQQIQRYEATGYARASLSRIREVATVLSSSPGRL